MLGLPDHVTACLFDLDGVLTQTARVHDAAWQRVFDEFLRAQSERTGVPFVPFDPAADYNDYVDGRPRADGVRTFLAARGIELPDGDAGDPVDAQTVNGLGNRKNQVLLDLIRSDGVQAYPGSVAYLKAARDAGLLRAVVSASANCADILAAAVIPPASAAGSASAGLVELLQVRVDGLVATRLGLRGKPAPDTFLHAARELGVRPGEAAVFEDAVAGVEAGRAGGFAAVVGVNRVGHADALRSHGASIVVNDLAELL